MRDAITVFICLSTAGALLGQSTGSSSQQTRAQQLQLSGRQTQQSGSVSVQQSTSGTSGSSVNTSSTSVQVQGYYSGSIPDQTAKTGAITLENAIQMGLRYNLGAVSASATLRQVRAQRLSALSQLLPTISGTVSETGAKTDLQTIGLSSGAFGGGFALPKVVGPYHYYDARATFNFNVLDMTARYNYRSAQAQEEAARLSDADARELVVLAVSGSYLKLLADQALVEAQQGQVQYAQASADQAVAQNKAGVKSLVDTERSQVELQTEQQRLTSQQADLIKDKRTLARAIGLSLELDIIPAEKLTYSPLPPLPLAEALKDAYAGRADLKSAAAQVKAAEETERAAHSEHLPTLNVNGYYALEGVNPNSGNGVFSGAASLNIPIFQGGRIKADEQQAKAAIDQRRAEYQDERGVVELDVRNAFTDFETSTNQVRLAESNRTLATQTLKQSQDRFAAGVANSVEVVQSQETLAAADRDYVSSLYSHNLAKISMARAIGQAETNITKFLKGQ